MKWLRKIHETNQLILLRNAADNRRNNEEICLKLRTVVWPGNMSDLTRYLWFHGNCTVNRDLKLSQRPILTLPIHPHAHVDRPAYSAAVLVLVIDPGTVTVCSFLVYSYYRSRAYRPRQQLRLSDGKPYSKHDPNVRLIRVIRFVSRFTDKICNYFYD